MDTKKDLSLIAHAINVFVPIWLLQGMCDTDLHDSEAVHKVAKCPSTSYELLKQLLYDNYETPAITFSMNRSHHSNYFLAYLAICSNKFVFTWSL